MEHLALKKILIISITMLMLACSATPIFIQGTPVVDYLSTGTTAPPLTTTVEVVQDEPTTAPKVVDQAGQGTDSYVPRSEAGIPLPYNENIMVNLATSSCDAIWSNNLAFLPCPGDRSGENGAVLRMDEPELSNGLKIMNRTLLTIPGYGSNGGGIFGRYLAYSVENERTHFMAGLSCLNFPCQADFGLGYYDSNGKYFDLVAWPVDSAKFSEEYGHLEQVDYDLSPFLGQTIELVLVVRNPPNIRVEALWIEPMIYLKY